MFNKTNRKAEQEVDQSRIPDTCFLIQKLNSKDQAC